MLFPPHKIHIYNNCCIHFKTSNLVNLEAATSNMNKSGYYEGYITHTTILEACKNLK